MCIYLTEDQNIQEVKNRRKIIDYYDKVVQGSAPLTIKGMENIDLVFGMSTEMGDTRKETKAMLFMKPKEKPEGVLEEALKRADKFMEPEEEVELDDEEKELEEELALHFFQLPQSTRERLQDRIPLKILKRLKDEADL